jgi:dihydrolipoamide dehydrogenase
LDVTLIDKQRPGGTCLHWGCIPSKAMIAGAHVLDVVRRAGEFGVQTGGAPTLDFGVLAERRDKVVETLAKGLEFLLGKRNVRVVKGSAAFAGPSTLSVKTADGSEKTLTFKHCLIATGSAPACPPGIALDGEYFVTSNEVVRWRQLPKDIVVIGAGVIGCEFAGLFARLGVAVQVVEMEAAVLPGFDEDLRKEADKALRRRKVRMHLGGKVEKAELAGAGVSLTLAGGQKIQAQVCIVAVGRKPYGDDLGLEKVGLAFNERRALSVDNQCRTAVPNLWAIGDVTGAIQLAHAATHMGLIAAEQIAGSARGGRDVHYDESLVPGAVFTDPEIACIGLTEEKANAAGRQIKVGRFAFRGLGKAHADGNLDGFVKVIADAQNDTVLGIHAAGAEATNLLGEFSLALQRKATLRDIAESVHAHPTLPEALPEAALAALGTPLHGV